MQVLAGFAALAGLAVAKTANAVDIKDARTVRDRGFDLIYEAREVELPQAVRDGLTQVGPQPLCASLIRSPGNAAACRTKPDFSLMATPRHQPFTTPQAAATWFETATILVKDIWLIQWCPSIDSKHCLMAHMPEGVSLTRQLAQYKGAS